MSASRAGKKWRILAILVASALCGMASAFGPNNQLKLKCSGERSDGSKTHIFLTMGGGFEIRNKSNELVYEIQKDNGFGTPGEYSQDYSIFDERIIFHSTLIRNKRMYTRGEINRKTGRMKIETTELNTNFNGVCEVGDYVPNTKF